MSGPGVRLSARVAVMNSASDVSVNIRTSLLLRVGALSERVQRSAADPIERPLIHRHRAERLVEVDRTDIPAEHGPLEATAAALDGDVGEMPQQRLAAAAATKRGSHEQILEVQARLAEKGREVVEEEREARDIGAATGDH